MHYCYRIKMNAYKPDQKFFFSESRSEFKVTLKWASEAQLSLLWSMKWIVSA